MSAPIDIENAIDYDDDMSDEAAVLIGESKAQCVEVDGVKAGRKWSAVWKDFDIVQKDGGEKAVCRHYKNAYVYKSIQGGTSSLRRHLKSCPIKNRDTQDVGQLLLSQINGQMNTRKRKLDQLTFREKVAQMIVKHNYPFMMVEHEGFRDVCTYLNEDVKHITRNTAKADVLKLHKKQMAVIRKVILSFPGRICLTSDLWTSINTNGYICLTAHFIDKNWELHKVVLNFSYMPPPHTGQAIFEKVFAMLGEWGIEDKVFTITMDNALSNDVCVQSMKSRLRLKNLLLGGGEYFHVRCCAHILNLVIKEGLKTINVAVVKLRESVKYLKGSQIRKTRFLKIVADLGMTNKKGLRQDVPTRWNSTYIMLESCMHYQNVFSHLHVIDRNYEYCPTEKEWEHIALVTSFLKLFYDVTVTFSGSKYPTANLYFHLIWKIEFTLLRESNNSDGVIRAMCIAMQGKFDKYWSDYNPILAMAMVLDPRYKMKFVEFCYRKMYPSGFSTRVAEVRRRMDSLLEEYSLHKSKENASNNGVASVGSSSHGIDFMGDEFEEFAQFESTDAQNPITELDLYLQEKVISVKAELDILRFWKSQEYRYPSLSEMARDILTIPITSVASESVFSVGGNILDEYRSSLTPENAEALVTTRDWLYGFGLDYLDVKTEDIVEDVLGVDNPTSSSHASNEVEAD